MTRLWKAILQAWTAFVLGLQGWEPDGWALLWPEDHMIKFSVTFFVNVNNEASYWAVSSGGTTWGKEYQTVFEAVTATKKLIPRTQPRKQNES